MSQRALYLSQTGMTEALGRSQVIPYLKGLVRAGWDMDLVAFEPATAREEDLRAVELELRDAGISYSAARRSPSHRFTVKLLEGAEAFVRLAARALRRRPRVVHARSYLPGAVALLVSSLSPGSRFLFDCRGLLGDEYVDFGYWRRDSFNYRLLKQVERRLFSRADAVVTLTDRLRRWLRDEAALVDPRRPVEVIPCCVDLDRFVVDEAARARTRAQLGAGDRFVLAYAGNLGSWYCEEEMARLFAELRRRRPALLAVYSRAPLDRLRAALKAARISEEDVWAGPVPPADMPAMLAGADAAISFARPCFSKIASSPVKIAEYLAVGLPVVMNRGVGDEDELLDGSAATVDAGQLSPEDLSRAADRLCALDLATLRPQARQAAERWFSLEQVGIPRYVQLYQRLAA